MRDETHAFGLKCEEHFQVMLADRCRCGQPHGYTTGPCGTLCPEYAPGGAR